MNSFDSEMFPGTDVDAALNWVGSLRADSGTGLAAGLAEAIKIGSTSPNAETEIDLLVVTDGLPNVGESTASGLLAEVDDLAQSLDVTVRIFGIGIGRDLDQALLNSLSEHTSGEATFALDDGEIGGQVLELFDRLGMGGVADASAQIEADGLAVDMFEWVRIFPDTTVYLGATGEVSTDVNVRFSGLTSENDVVAASMTFDSSIFDRDIQKIAAPLAAKAFTDQIARTIDRYGETNERVEQALMLAKTYGIVTRYSSLLALETPELYEEYGVERIERDPAGIALSPIALGQTDESRIGGDGTDDNSLWPSSSPDSAFDNDLRPASVTSGCHCNTRSVTGAPLFGLLGLMMALGFIRRRRVGLS